MIKCTSSVSVGNCIMSIKNLSTIAGLAAGAAMVLSAGTAQAVSFSILGYECPTTTCVDLGAGGYDVTGGAVLSGTFPNKALTPGSNNKVAPDLINDAYKVTSYNVVSRKDEPVAGAINPIYVTGLGGAFDFFWGSVDTYNIIEFFHSGTSVGTFTGSDIAAFVSGLTGNTITPNNVGNYHFDAYVLFEGMFDSAKLSVHETLGTGVAFEVATKTAVPEPTAVLGLVAVGLLSGGSMLKRKSQDA